MSKNKEFIYLCIYLLQSLLALNFKDSNKAKLISGGIFQLLKEVVFKYFRSNY